MALMPVYFTTTSTKKRKVKYASSEQKQKSIQLQQDWEDMMKKYDAKPVRKLQRKVYTPPPPSVRREVPHYPSLDTGGNATKPINHQKVYTGTKMIGIAVMHKSNSVPVFSQDDAKEISKMRRG
jgi:hypothetical protein